MGKPQLTIVVVFHNMRREGPRTLHTLSPAYQQGVAPGDYRVVAVDNASDQPLGPDAVTSFGPNFAYFHLQHDGKSPAAAVNYGVAQAQTEFVAIIVDGARMVSPGMVSTTRSALRAFDSPLVGALSWHLGRDVRSRWKQPYDQSTEDELLEQFDWRTDGYELFRHSLQRKRSQSGFLSGLPTELTFLAMRRTAFERLGGYEERFASPGGGLINQDFLKRAVEMKCFDFAMLLGEGTFHQFHGGVTSGSEGNQLRDVFMEEYRQIRGEPYQRFKQPKVTYFGSLHEAAWPFVRSAPVAERQK